MHFNNTIAVYVDGKLVDNSESLDLSKLLGKLGFNVEEVYRLTDAVPNTVKGLFDAR